MIADEALAIFRFEVIDVDPEYGDEASGTLTLVQGEYTSADVLWGAAPYDGVESGVYTFSMVLPGGTVTWDSSAPLFDIGVVHFYPGETYLGFFYHGEWDVTPVVSGPLGYYREVTQSSRTIYVNDTGNCLENFDSTNGPLVTSIVTSPMKIWGPYWNSERLELEREHGGWESPPDDEGEGTYPEDDSPENWDDNFASCTTASTINNQIVAVMTPYSPVSTTWEWLTAFDDEPGELEDDTVVSSEVCWVDHTLPYFCEDTPQWPERDAVLEVFDEANIVGYFPMDEVHGDELYDWTAYGNGSIVNDDDVVFGQDPLLAGQGTSILWGADAHGELGDTRWNYIHQTGEFTVMFWLNAAQFPSYWYEEVIGNSLPIGMALHRGFCVAVNGSGSIAATYRDGTMTAQSVFSSSSLSVGVPAHVAVTGDGSSFRLYINGELEGTNSNLSATTGDALELVVGARLNLTTYFDGMLDDLVFLDYGASSQEITEYYRASVQNGPFDQEDVTDLALWLDTSDVSTMWTTTGKTINVSASDDEIRVIDDLSGNGNHLTYQSTAPTYQSAGFAGGPTARFAGGAHEWRRTAITNATPQTIVFVGRNDDVTYGSVVSSGSGGSQRTALLMDTSPTTGMGPGFDDGGATTPFDEYDYLDHDGVYVVVFDAEDTVRLFVNGDLVGEEEYAGWTNTGALFRVGGTGSTPDFDLSELRIYDRALDGWEVMSLTSQLAAKWGL